MPPSLSEPHLGCRFPIFSTVAFILRLGTHISAVDYFQILQVWVLRWTLNSVLRNKVFGVSTGGCFPSFYQWLQVIISPLQPASLNWAHWMRSSASCCFWSLALEQKSVVMLHKIRLIMNFSLFTIGLFWQFCHYGEESRTDGSQGNPASDHVCITPLCRRWP